MTQEKKNRIISIICIIVSVICIGVAIFFMVRYFTLKASLDKDNLTAIFNLLALLF